MSRYANHDCPSGAIVQNNGVYANCYTIPETDWAQNGRASIDRYVVANHWGRAFIFYVAIPISDGAVLPKRKVLARIAWPHDDSHWVINPQSTAHLSTVREIASMQADVQIVKQICKGLQPMGEKPPR